MSTAAPAPDSTDHAAVGTPAAVAEIVRSGFVEGHHYGSIVALDTSGEISWSVGSVDTPMLPRSCNKPLQALGMVRAGLTLPPDLLALASASHSGEAFHIEGVRRILALARLDEADLRTPPMYPLQASVRDTLIRVGGDKDRIHSDCSGKHAAMLVTCVVNGWDTASYLKPDHPVQQAIRDAIEDLTGVEVTTTAIDGCGAPLLSTTLVGLARAFRSLAVAGSGPEREVADAIRLHPEFVSGTTRPERALLAAIPGAIGKIGAESCYVLALPDGRAYALKVHDGAMRAWPVVIAAALQRDGVHIERGVDTDAIRRVGRHLLLGGGRPVGEVRACF